MWVRSTRAPRITLAGWSVFSQCEVTCGVGADLTDHAPLPYWARLRYVYTSLVGFVFELNVV